MPVFPNEILPLILNRHNFSQSEAVSMCLVSKQWKKLGIWRRVLIMPEDACTLDPVQILLLENSKTARRLGRLIKELIFNGIFIFTELEEEDSDYDSDYESPTLTSARTGISGLPPGSPSARSSSCSAGAARRSSTDRKSVV